MSFTIYDNVKDLLPPYYVTDAEYILLDKDENKIAINLMNYGNNPVFDCIPCEVINHGGNVMVDSITNLLVDV